MKIRREFKIGVFAVITILVAWWGIKWLGGQNVLITSSTYYAYYDDVSGLIPSSRIKLRGVEIGNVQDIELENTTVRVEMLIEDKYIEMIPSNSVAEIRSAGLMGGTEINIIQGDAKDFIVADGTIKGVVKPDMIGSMADKAGELLNGLNTTVESVNSLLSTNSETITDLISNLEAMSSSVNSIVASAQSNIEGTLTNLNTFTQTLSQNSSRIENMLSNLDQFSEDLAEAQFVAQLRSTLAELDAIVKSINEGDGTAGMLINDKALYDSLNQASGNLAALLEDLKANPMRYVHFSLFGQSEEKAAERAAKKAEREERRAAKKQEAEENE
ncbi:MAG: MCE family protein [Alistipes sp.]|jgi:phospholipid/cholesterol/gamma-HCH transport system substrate-binding protein|nr:MCE family protein [Alistipes sp.]